MKIIKDLKFNNVNLNTSPKCSNGFYLPMLRDLFNLLIYSFSVHSKPKAVHFVIDAPIECKIKRINSTLNRWQTSRNRLNRCSRSMPLYFHTLEVRPRNKQKHLHLLVILDSCTYNDAISLEDHLRSISSTNKCRLQRRDISELPAKVDSETGEIKMNSNLGISRVGSITYHSVTYELNDCFTRISYFAKVYSKTGDPIWSVSRIPSSKITIPPPNIRHIQSVDNSPVA